MLKAKIDLKRDDLLINYTTKDSMLMNNMDSMPWHGAQEKDSCFIQFIIEGTTNEGELVLNCTSSVGEFGFPQIGFQCLCHTKKPLRY